MSSALSIELVGCCYLKRSFAILTPSIFLPLYKAFYRPHLEYAIQASSPILSWDFQALESVQKFAVKFVKGLRHVPYETALVRSESAAFSTFHAVHFLLPHPHYASRSHFQDSPTAVLNPSSSTCVQRSSSPVQEQTAGGDC